MDFWLVSYVFALFGSISFGYLLLRFAFPDIRVLPREVKLGLAGFAGIMIFLLSAIPSYFFLTPMFAYAIMPFIVLISFGFVELKNLVSPPKTVKVAVPVVRFKEKKPEKEEKLTKVAEKLKKKAEKVRVEETAKKEKPVAKVKKKAVAEGIKKEAVQEVKKEKPAEVKVVEVKPKPEKKPKPRLSRAMRKELREKRASFFKALSDSVSKLLEAHKERYAKRKHEVTEQIKTEITAQPTAPVPEVTAPELDLGEAVDLSSLETLSLEDLGIEPSPEIGELEELEEGIDLSSLAGFSEIEEVPKEKEVKCPNCGAKNVQIIYCPYCGKGFCSNCALQVRHEGDLVIYKCPHCGKDVIVKAEEVKA